MADPTAKTEHEAQEHLREMEEFTYAIALDLRRPLRHIESFTEILLKNAAERLDQKSRGYLRTISDATHRMSRLIDDLFTFTRIGQTEMHRLRISLAELVREVVHDLRHETEDRRIEWVIGALPEVEGDPVMLWLVFSILISNALKFTRPRAVARIEVGSDSLLGENRVFVRDNGVGFDPDHSEKLFGVFQRLHAEKDFEGTGIGLANVRRILERHGGRAWAEGEIDRGATITIALPQKAA